MITGTEFLKRIASLGYSRARDLAVLDALASRIDWPLVPLTSHYNGHTGTIFVTSDVLAIGTPDDLVRMPVGADVAQVIADELGMMLITPYVSQLIDEQAIRRLKPRPHDPTAGRGLAMMDIPYLVTENAEIEAQLHAMGARFGDLVSCLGKDVVVCNHCGERPGDLVICGWDLDPDPLITHWIQPGLGGIGLQAPHEIAYRDYSHKHRFMCLWMLVDGARMLVADVAKDPALAPLISREIDARGKPAAWTFLRYPTDRVAWQGAPPRSPPIPPSVPPPPLPALAALKVGDKGAQVMALQTALNRAGSTPTLRADGVFGPNTKASVLTWQTAAGLPRTGEADEGTITALARALPPAPASSSPTSTTPPAIVASAGRLGVAVLARAVLDLGVREKGGHNRGARIDEYNRNAGVALGSDYCGPGLMTWLAEACAATGLRAPLKGSPAAKGWEAQLRELGRWMPRAQLGGKVGPCMVIVFDRKPPALSWQGHVGIVESVSGAGPSTMVHMVEANGGPSDGVYRLDHLLTDPLMRGGGFLD